ncbi:MAG: hypothetical protein K0R09_3230 [Clostridiales bacterium]|jgi:uncharacterized protein (DUF1015 family)|nr:hypothetical protein [Clostridiales bacterium]
MKNNIGVKVPTILMPKADVDISKWAVIACDQYTSQPEYWEEVKKVVGDNYSTLNLILPEVYLEDKEYKVPENIKKIHANMREHLDKNILVPQKPGFIYVERLTESPVPRKGLVLAIDLEEYDYNLGSQSLVRPTEKTVIERIPPRVKIRENASVEFPHIMLLIDDPNEAIIEPISNMKDKLERVYDFDMMMGGGHISGYKIDNEALLTKIIKGLEELAKPEVFNKKYELTSDKPILLFAVGDGNHSLASAKAHWENVKKTLKEDQQADHPARFALVEVVNIHDKSLIIEPIHRELFNVDEKGFFDALTAYFNGSGSEVNLEYHNNRTVMDIESLETEGDIHKFSFITKDKSGVITIKHPKANIPVGTIQVFLDEYLKSNPKAKIDYIHGTDVINDLSSKDGNMGFILPPISKSDLFKTIVLDGVMPRKTFSMGEAQEKRYYIEGRKIVL